jgi:hypothetical protein
MSTQAKESKISTLKESQMSLTQTQIIGAAAFYLFIFLSGFWLSSAGKPLNDGIFTVHKLVSVAAVIFLGVTFYRLHQAGPLATLAIAGGTLTALLFLGTIVSGGLMAISANTGDPLPAIVLRLHQLTSPLTVLATAATIYVLSARS